MLTQSEKSKRHHEKHKDDPKWKEYRKQYAQTHKELYQAASRKWRAKNREESRQKAKEYWESLPLPERREKRLRANIRRYGVDRDWLDQKLIEQTGRCALCDAPSKTLCIDHDHKKGSVRGLLCPSCNFALHARIDLEWHRRVVSYLEKYADTIPVSA